MTLRTSHGNPTAEAIGDVHDWLRSLADCPVVTMTAVAECHNHGADAANWFYVEADPAEGVARIRCLGCGRVQHLLDSESRWTYPSTWACRNCQQSIAEVAIGGHDVDGQIDWLAVAVRCVECGSVQGLTDVVPQTAQSELTTVFSSVEASAF